MEKLSDPERQNETPLHNSVSLVSVVFARETIELMNILKLFNYMTGDRLKLAKLKFSSSQQVRRANNRFLPRISKAHNNLPKLIFSLDETRDENF